MSQDYVSDLTCLTNYVVDSCDLESIPKCKKLLEMGCSSDFVAKTAIDKINQQFNDFVGYSVALPLKQALEFLEPISFLIEKVEIGMDADHTIFLISVENFNTYIIKR